MTGDGGSVPDAGWYPDPTGQGGLRWFDGAAWTEHTTPSGASAGSPPDPWDAGPDEDDEGLLKLGVQVLGHGALNLLIWLAPVIVLGGLGLLLFGIGSTTTESTGLYGESSTELDGVGWIGAGLVLLAVACFFGRGTLQSIARVIRGEAGLGEIVLLRGTLISALIGGGAVLGALVCFFIAIAGG